MTRPELCCSASDSKSRRRVTQRFLEQSQNNLLRKTSAQSLLHHSLPQPIWSCFLYSPSHPFQISLTNYSSVAHITFSLRDIFAYNAGLPKLRDVPLSELQSHRLSKQSEGGQPILFQVQGKLRSTCLPYLRPSLG